MVYVYIKGLLAVVIVFAALHTFRFMFSTSYYLSARTSLEAFRAGTWTCELDKRLVVHLRQEIRSKEKLLKYREKVINTLRKQISMLNVTETVNSPSTAAVNVSIAKKKRALDKSVDALHTKEVVMQKKAGEGLEQAKTATSEPTPFPENLDKIASTGQRPCCMALKRMSDILRQYMDITRDLKHQVAIYEQTNITEKLIRYGEVVKKQTIAKNCSSYFLPKRVEKQKDEIYMTSDMHAVYEAQPLYMKPKQNIGNFGAKHRNADLKAALNWGLKEFNKKMKENGEKSKVTDVIFKSDPMKGNQYIFTIKTKKGKTFNIPVLRPLGPYILDGKITDQSAKIRQLINIILPLSGRAESLDKFIQMFREICVEHGENVFLTVVIYGNTTSSIKLKERIVQFSKNTKFAGIDIMRKDLPFSRGRALDDGVKRWNGNKNVLMFFCDVDVSFDRNFLRRCRINTQPNKQVYYPIIFSQYNPYISRRNESNRYSVEIDEESGTWRPLGFGMTCMYRSDYLKVGGFNLKIKGWGGEDNDLFSRYLFFKFDSYLIRSFFVK